MSVSLFLVIPTGSQLPISGEPVTDPFFASGTFSKATVIQLSSADFGVENLSTISATSSGASAGKAKFDELVVRKNVDRSSPYLFSALGSGGHFASAQLYLRKDGTQDAKPYLAYEFQTVFVTKINWDASSGDDALTENVTFVYGAMAVAYRLTMPDGTLGAVTKSAWSQITNSSAVADTLVIS